MIREAQGGQPDASRSSSTSPTAPCTRRCTPRPTTSRSTAAATTPGGTRSASRALRAPAASSGVVAGHVELAAAQHRARATTCRPWDELADDEQRLFARYMEVFAAMVDNIDQNVGRLRRRARGAGRARQHDRHLHLRQRRVARGRGRRARPRTTCTCSQGDDIDADLRPPRPHRRAADHAALPARAGRWRRQHAVPPLQDQHPRRRPLGAVHRARGPARLGADAGALRRQYAHVTDVLPTLLELIGVERARPSATASPLKPLAGTSFVADARTTPTAPTAHTEQYYEMHRPPRLLPRRLGGRDAAPAAHAVRRRASGSCTTSPTTRPSCTTSPPSSPTSCAELAAAWEEAAWANQVYPLDEGTQRQVPASGPPRSEVFGEPVTICRGTPTLERWRSVQLIWFRVVHRHGRPRPPRRRRGRARRPRRPGRRLRALRARRRAASSCTTTAAAACASRRAARCPTARAEVVARAASRRAGNVWDARRCRSTARSAPRVDGRADAVRHGARSRASTSASTAARRCRGTLYERFGPFPYTGTLHAVHVQPGEPAPDSPVQHARHAPRDGRQVRVAP